MLCRIWNSLSGSPDVLQSHFCYIRLPVFVFRSILVGCLDFLKNISFDHTPPWKKRAIPFDFFSTLDPVPVKSLVHRAVCFVAWCRPFRGRGRGIIRHCTGFTFRARRTARTTARTTARSTPFMTRHRTSKLLLQLHTFFYISRSIFFRPNTQRFAL